MSMKIERSSLDQVKNRFTLNKKKLEEKKKDYDFEERVACDYLLIVLNIKGAIQVNIDFSTKICVYSEVRICWVGVSRSNSINARF